MDASWQLYRGFGGSESISPQPCVEPDIPNLVECTAPIFAATKIASPRPILPNPYIERVQIPYGPRVATLREALDR